MATSVSTEPCPACGVPPGRPGAGTMMKGYPLHRCPSCGLQSLHPQPDDQVLEGIYRREYYDAWGLHTDEEMTRGLKRAMFARMLRQVVGRPEGTSRLLDCGAALGYLMEEAQAAGMEPYGVELSEFGASKIAEKFGPDRVFCGPFEQAEFAFIDHDFFDVVTMFDFIEHVRDPEAILAKGFRLLRPGGKVVILTPNAGSLSRRLMGLRWLHYKVEHLFYFTPSSLRRCLERVGFTGVQTRPAWKTMNLHYVYYQLSHYPHPVLTPILSLAHRLSPPSLRQAMFRVTFGEMLTVAVKPGPGGVGR